MSIPVIVKDVRCPVCHTDAVKAFKVHNGGQWWHRCLGETHGVFSGPEDQEIDTEGKQLWFNEAGNLIEIDEHQLELSGWA